MDQPDEPGAGSCRRAGAKNRFVPLPERTVPARLAHVAVHVDDVIRRRAVLKVVTLTLSI